MLIEGIVLCVIVICATIVIVHTQRLEYKKLAIQATKIVDENITEVLPKNEE